MALITSECGALQLQSKREQVESLQYERDRLAEDISGLQEDCFEAREQLDELDTLRRQASHGLQLLVAFSIHIAYSCLLRTLLLL